VQGAEFWRRERAGRAATAREPVPRRRAPARERR
jgi:hypothetical protein